MLNTIRFNVSYLVSADVIISLPSSEEHASQDVFTESPGAEVSSKESVTNWALVIFNIESITARSLSRSLNT